MTEGEDFYYNEEGLLVFTARYHLERGVCCGNNCRHCPFDHIHVPEKLTPSDTETNMHTGNLS